jgi:hypothetical protein
VRDRQREVARAENAEVEKRIITSLEHDLAPEEQAERHDADREAMMSVVVADACAACAAASVPLCPPPPI